MKRVVHRAALLIIVTLTTWNAACTPLREGVSAGITDGFSAAFAAIIEAPFDYLIEQWLAGKN